MLDGKDKRLAVTTFCEEVLKFKIDRETEREKNNEHKRNKFQVRARGRFRNNDKAMCAITWIKKILPLKGPTNFYQPNPNQTGGGTG